MTRSVLEFAERWQLEESALTFLQSLPPDQQVSVISQFDPRGETRNISGKLIAFAKSVSSVRRENTLLESFAQYWALDDDTRMWLRSLPEEALNIVIQEFDPRGDTINPSGKLKVFAKGVVAKLAMNGPFPQGGTFPQGGLASTPMQEATPLNAGQEAAAPFPAFTGGPVPAPAEEQGADVSTIANAKVPGHLFEAFTTFAFKWNLDASSIALLESLSEEALDTVLKEFDPRDDTRNVGAKLRAFASAVGSGQGKGAPRGKGGWGGGWAAPQMPVFNAAQSGVSVPDPAEEQFLWQWGLSSDYNARDALRRLPPVVRARVMREFMPAQNTNNISGKFTAFAASVGRAAMEGAGQMTSFGRPPFERPPFGAAMGPRGKGGYGMNVAPWPRQPPLWEAFADSWFLDEGSRALLKGLDPPVQAVVMDEFLPPEGTEDISANFCEFARSVASRASASRGTKREAPPDDPFTARARLA